MSTFVNYALLSLTPTGPEPLPTSAAEFFALFLIGALSKTASLFSSEPIAREWLPFRRSATSPLTTIGLGRFSCCRNIVNFELTSSAKEGWNLDVGCKSSACEKLVFIKAAEKCDKHDGWTRRFALSRPSELTTICVICFPWVIYTQIVVSSSSFDLNSTRLALQMMASTYLGTCIWTRKLPFQQCRTRKREINPHYATQVKLCRWSSVIRTLQEIHICFVFIFQDLVQWRNVGEKWLERHPRKIVGDRDIYEYEHKKQFLCTEQGTGAMNVGCSSVRHRESSQNVCLSRGGVLCSFGGSQQK